MAYRLGLITLQFVSPDPILAHGGAALVILSGVTCRSGILSDFCDAVSFASEAMLPNRLPLPKERITEQYFPVLSIPESNLPLCAQR